MTSLAASFLNLFAGLQRSHGIYVVPSNATPNEKGKLHAANWARTVHGEVTEALWEQHLAGKAGLGIVPIRDDSSALFGAIDIDIYPLNLPALAGKVHGLDLPLIVCRTKSGGAHLYLFLEESAPAELVRTKLAEWSTLLGYPKAEIFPKQSHLSPDSDGSWINVPYVGGARSLRYALGADGKALSPEGFIEYAAQSSITKEQLTSFEITIVNNDDFEEAPPCLQTLAVKGFGDWQNSGMFNVAVYLRKRYGDGWESRAHTYNNRYMHPPELAQGMLNIIKSVNKKKYFYTCKQEPICGVCDKKTCSTREFGVGGLPTDQGVIVGELLKIETDPPSYIVEVEGMKVSCDVDDLIDQRKFRRLVFMRLNTLIPVIKSSAWEAIIKERLTRLSIDKVPDEATHEGQFWVHVQQFCTNSRFRGKSLDELLRHVPYTEEGRTYFCSGDLFAHLNKNRFNSITEKDVFGWLRKRDIQQHSTVLKGKPTEYWSIPAFPEQTQEHAVPRAPIPERM